MTDAPNQDQNQANPQAAQPPGPPSIRVLAQYIKDLSFENPGLFGAQQGRGPRGSGVKVLRDRLCGRRGDDRQLRALIGDRQSWK